MKVSLKVREERVPLLRAQLPLNVLGLPLFTGVTSGDPRELALHLGTYVGAGPSFRLSYKPNNAYCPFSVLVKTGFGLWGSPNGSALALSAEVDLNSTGAPTFSVRVKPRVGDFGFKKDTRRFTATYEEAERSGDEIAVGLGDSSKYIVRSGEVKRHEPGMYAAHSLDGPHSANDNGLAAVDDVQKNVTGLGTGSGAFSSEDVESTGIRGKIDSFKSEGKSKEIAEHVKEVFEGSPRGTGYMDVYDDRLADSEGDVEILDLSGLTVESKPGRSKDWLRGCEKGWSLSAHSSLPISNRAVARFRWHVKFGSNLFHDVRHGMHITDIKLPAFSIDKVSFEALDPFKSSSAKSRIGGTDLGLGSVDGNDSEESQLGRITALCASMRYQLQLLHSENKVLKSTMDELRGDLGNKKPAGKGTELMIQEDNALRSQMFEELNRKVDGGSRNKGREGSSNKDIFSKGESLDLGKLE